MSKKILIVQRRPGIGDMCLFYPCINEICSAHKSYNITLMTSKRSKPLELLKHYKLINSIKYYENFRGVFGFLRFVKYLIVNKFDKLIIFHHGLKYFLAYKLSNTKKLSYYGLKKEKKNIVEESRNFVMKILNNNNLEFSTQLPLLNKKIKHSENKIIFGIGGSGSDKKWHLVNFINLAKKIYIIKKVKIIIAGGYDEIEDYNFIKKELKNFNLFSVCEMKISEAIAHLKNSIFYIGNDTGFMHLSGILGINSYGLFGNTPLNYASYNNKIKTIIPENFNSITHGSDAMDKISVDHVFNVIQKELK